MKKILALAMTAVLAVMTLASCGGKYAEGDKFAKGKFEDGKYENESVGIAIKLPEGYTAGDTSKLPAVADVTYDFYASDENGNVICVTNEVVKNKKTAEKIATESLEAVKEQYERTGFVVNDSKLLDHKVDGNLYRGFSIDYTYGETNFEQFVFFVVCEESVATVAYTAKDGETEAFVKANVVKA